MRTDDPTPLLADWRGQKQYKCRLCAFDTLDEQQFVAHFAGTHAPWELVKGGRQDVVSEPEPEPVVESEPEVKTVRHVPRKAEIKE